MRKTLLLLESYKDTDEYKNAAKRVYALSKELERMRKEQPEKEKVSDEDMRNAAGYSVEEWKDMSRSEKEAMYQMFKTKESDYDKWFSKYNSINDELSDALATMKSISDKEYQKQYGNKEVSLGIPTNKTDFEGFKLDTGTSHQDLLEDKDRARRHGYKNVQIVEMTPDEYMHAISKYIFKTPIEQSYDGMLNKDSIDEYAEMMKNGTKFDMPYIDLKTKGQEGRHRALAAKKLGIEKIPVLILE